MAIYYSVLLGALRLSLACDPTVNYVDSNGECLSKRECVYYDVAAETPTTDRVCVPVPSGKFAVNATHVQNWRQCPSNYRVAGEGTALSDVVCEPCNSNSVTLEAGGECICLPGHQPVHVGHYPCEPCPLNFFKDTASLDSCVPCRSESDCEGGVLSACTPLRDLQCVDCSQCGCSSSSEFVRLMCASVTTDKCDACIREHSNGLFKIVGNATAVNATASYRDLQVTSVAIATHPARNHSLGRPIGIVERKTVALAFVDDFTAQVLYGNVELDIIDVGVTEKVDVVGSKLVWTSGTYDVLSCQGSVLSDSKAWQRIQVNEHTFAELGQSMPLLLANNDTQVTCWGWTQISPFWNSITQYLDEDSYGNTCAGIDSTFTGKCKIGVHNVPTPPADAKPFSELLVDECRPIRAFYGGERIVFAPAKDTTFDNIGVFAPLSDRVVVWTSNASTTTLYEYSLGPSSLTYLKTVHTPHVYADLNVGAANTYIAVTDSKFVVLDTNLTELNATTLEPVVDSVANETRVQGCVLLGGSCSADEVCCEAEHTYASYSSPPSATVANVVMLAGETPPEVATLEVQPIQFRGTPNGTATVSSAERLKARRLTAEERRKPVPMGVKALGYNRRGGFAAFQSLLANCEGAPCEECGESLITTADGHAQVNASQRNVYVRGQTLPTNKSFLGTFFRGGDINDKLALAQRGSDIGVLAGDVNCDRKSRAGLVVLGTNGKGACGDPVTGVMFDGNKTAYHNRWYLDQATHPGTPLWPSGAKSEFGVCCAYRYATFGTLGYRRTSSGAGEAPNYNDGAGLKGPKADTYNKYSASLGFRMTTPRIPDVLTDKLGMCYTDAPPIRAVEPNQKLPQARSERRGDACRVGDPHHKNIWYNQTFDKTTVSAFSDWKDDPFSDIIGGTDPFPAEDVETVDSVDGTMQIDVWPNETGATETFASSGSNMRFYFSQTQRIRAIDAPYRAGHAVCSALRKAKGGVSTFHNIEARPWPETQPILRSFVNPVHWDSAGTAEACRKEVIKKVIYSNLESDGGQVKKCSEEGGDGPTRWFQNGAWRHSRRLANTMTCYDTHTATSTKVSTVALPFAGLFDIMKVDEVRMLPPFSITVYARDLPLELFTEDLSGPQTTVKTGQFYQVVLQPLIHMDSLAKVVPKFRARNLPDWLTFDAVNGIINGTAPLLTETTESIELLVIMDIYEASLPVFNLEVIDSDDVFELSGVPRTTSLQGTTYLFQPKLLNPDNLGVVFSLNQNVSGLTINPHTGLLNGTLSTSVSDLQISVRTHAFSQKSRGVLMPMCDTSLITQEKYVCLDMSELENQDNSLT